MPKQKSATSRFIADTPPVIVPRGASRQKQLELGFPVVPPLAGTKLRAEYDRLVRPVKALFGRGGGRGASAVPRKQDPRSSKPL